MLGLPLVLAWLFSLSAAHDRLEAGLQDAGLGLVARAQQVDDVLVVEIDEASLLELEPYFSSWPYARDVYALMLDYLGEMQARAVFFDLAFADPRAGDAQLRAALARNPRAILAASAVRGVQPGSASPATLAALGWARADADAAALPALRWPALVAPDSLLGGEGAGPRVGVISFEYDTDGVLRRFPLLHRIGDHYLPSVLLATLHPGAPPPALSVVDGRLRVGERDWAVDAEGQVRPLWPANPDPVLAMSFARLMKAVLGEPGHALDAAELRGKTVFVGSTTLFADRVHTPRGVVSGVHVLATAHAALARAQYLAQPAAGWNLCLLLLAALPALWTLARRTPPPPAQLLAGSVAALFAVGATWLGLLAHAQPAWLLTPLLFGACSGAVGAAQAQAGRVAAAAGRAQAAEAAAVAQRQAVALVSHELRSPLATIDLALQNLGRVPDLPPGVRARHERMLRASRRLQALADYHLAHDRLRQSGAGEAPEAVDLAALIDDLVAAADWPALEVEHGGAGRAECAAWVLGDREMLRVALSNLIDNAIKYSPTGGAIRVGVAAADGMVTVAVRDHGIGIAAADLPHLFEPYFRAEGLTQPGSGLGLALVRQIVEGHGGRIGVDSAPGAGTCFTVGLPQRAPG